jgi:hypothetical protein
MTEIDSELDRRLSLLCDAAEPTAADKHRLFLALRRSIAADADNSSRPVPPERAAGVTRDRQPWVTAVRPLVPWLGGAVIGASAALTIEFGWDRAPGRQEREQVASGGGAVVAARDLKTNDDTNITGAARLAEQVDAVVTEGVEASVDGTVGPPGMADTRTTPVQSSLAEALEQLHRAERALYAGDAQFALGILSDLDRRAEPALLREERLTTRVLALCQGDRIEEALDARRQLEREFASSIYARRLDQSCAIEREHR